MSIKFNSVIKPMLAVRSEPFDSDEYLFEIKWDGTRCIAFVNRRTVRLQNRRLRNITYRYPELSDLNRYVNGSVILDGEVIVIKNGKPSFRLLQMREHVDDEEVIKLRAKLYPAVYIVFDLLYYRGKDITSKPLIERKQLLKQTGINRHPHVIVLDHIERYGKRFFRLVKKEGLEGVMAKHKYSPYEPGKRSRYWKKIKVMETVDAIICGFRHDKRKISSLLLCLYTKTGSLKYIGSVGTGFDEETMGFLEKVMEPFITDRPAVKGIKIKDAVWVKPVIVCEVGYQEVTHDGRLRAPVFKRIRYDKAPEECTVDQVKHRG